MHYKLIVNQPFTSTVNVLAAALHFVHVYDPRLLRLEEHWRVYPGGVIYLHDSFNNQDIPIGKEAGDEYDPDDHYHYFSNDFGNYKILDSLSKGQLDDLMEVLNDHYCSDCFAVSKTLIGYGYYKVEESTKGKK